MDERWRIRSLEVRGGFLDGLNILLPPGLTCIIGPRGSGKSTLAEALRYAVTGNERAAKPRQELFRSNLARAVVTLTTAQTTDGNAYIVRREARQPPLVSTVAGVAIQNVDLDRGTFLPLDGYSSLEIEELADEALSDARRALVDDLEPAAMSELRDVALRALRALESNADQVRRCKRTITDLREEEQSLAHVRERLAGLPTPAPDDVAAKRLQEAARQTSLNTAETKSAAAARTRIGELLREIRAFAQRATFLASPISVAGSRNSALTAKADAELADAASTIEDGVAALEEVLNKAAARLDVITGDLQRAHHQQATEFAAVRDENMVATEAARERAQAEAEVQRLQRVEEQIEAGLREEAALLSARRDLRRDYNAARDAISARREAIAQRLESKAGEKVRITVRKNADKLEYRQVIEHALKGIGVKQHESIIDGVTSNLRPGDLAAVIELRNYDELDRTCRFGPERSRRILDGLRQAVDPLTLETMPLDDEITIELNVGTKDSPVLRDASKLSRGQKCTALLPLLLARRDTPIVIDQPEDNLDNHFIFNTVVETIVRMKRRRQMVFITHNANIPVLAEADLIIVLDSDGRTGHVKKSGSLDDCKSEIIDLLEGGKAAFDLRRRRYESK
jgi:ABC-type cobalamin/Fe3+-siderophores transport system ATPase subunit